jgi:hypothetical protein
MLSRRPLIASVAVLLGFAVPFLPAQSERHGRKYKAPPETSHLEILVVKDTNGKILENAAVIFHPTKDGNDEGNLEIKSGTDGKAFIDIIPTGSDVAIQIIASGFTTYAGNIKLDAPSKQLTIRMKRPTTQVSAYDETEAKDINRKVGVQEPIRNAGPTSTPKPLPSSAPVIKLPSLPQNAKAKGDVTVAPVDHNVTPAPSKPAKAPENTSGSTAPVTDGSPGTSSPSN